MDEVLAELGRRTLAHEPLRRPLLLELVERSHQRPHDLLYWANRVREQRFGNVVRLCCIVPGKLGGCSEDCKWCAQSAPGAPGVTPVRRATRDELVAAARSTDGCGAGRLGIVNSGRRPTARDLADVCAAAGAIGAAVGGVGVCASLGELTDEQARQLAAGGVGRYHHNLETSRPHFARMVSTHSYDDRLATCAAARRAGMSLCSGGLLGIGETWEDRVDLAIALRDEVRPDVAPLNFLHAIPGTALEHQPPLAPMEALRIIALFRLAMPRTDIKIAGGRQAVLGELQSWIFYAGATSLMTGELLTTHNRGAADDLRMIEALGLQVVRG